MIKPTVGRVVLYNPLDTERQDIRHAALVVMVHSDELVNLTCFDQNGVPYHRQNVALIQDPIVAPKNGQCEWMPYQHGQAAKYDVAMDAVLARIVMLEQTLANEGVELNRTTPDNVVDIDSGAEGPGTEEVVLADEVVTGDVLVDVPDGTDEETDTVTGSGEDTGEGESEEETLDKTDGKAVAS